MLVGCVMDEARLDDSVRLATGEDLGLSGSRHVLDPLRVAPVGERDPEPPVIGKTFTGVRKLRPDFLPLCLTTPKYRNTARETQGDVVRDGLG